MKNRINRLVTVVVSAGNALLVATPTDGLVKKEGQSNIVTDADMASERAIITAIKSDFPGDAILSEESVPDLPDAVARDRLWVIDPLDGTNNFYYQRDYSSVSVAYVERGVVLLGAVYNPFRKELFLAEKGNGATVNEHPLRVSDQSDFATASVATDNWYDPAGTRRNLEIALSIPTTPWLSMRGCASLAMCDVAAGRLDLYFHTYLKPWDNAAAFLIAQEAGARICGIDGQAVTFMSEHVVLGVPSLVQHFPFQR